MKLRDLLPRNAGFNATSTGKRAAVRRRAAITPTTIRSGGVGVRERVLGVAAFLAVASLALVARAVDLQFIHKDFYQQQGDSRFLRELPIATSRGMITDRNGEPLALSTPVESLWANPSELALHPDRFPQLAQALGVPVKDLTTQIQQRASKEFMYLRRHLNPDEAQAIVALGVPGVFSQREYRRFYPLGEVMGTCWATPTSTIAARKELNSHSTNG